ncbi:Zinc finger CCCH domain-containing protein 46, partial [Zea mays]
MHMFPVCSPRMDRGDLIGSPATRQIVSNYFSIFGPVQDMRIPYQQKRMFGFVTFMYAEMVKAILSKGNPHFVCDARVLVKPYKEKGKVPGRFRKLQHAHHGGAEFAGCASPTGLLDSRDLYALLLLSGAQVFTSEVLKVVEDGLREASFEIGLDDRKVHKEMDKIYTL